MEGLAVAAADMGTNTFHMIVAKPLSHGRFYVIDSHKEYVRLGTKAVIDGEPEERALNAVKSFKSLAESRRVGKVKIVATAAVREAQNKEDFLAKVKQVSGFDVDVLSGIEEARLTYLGILQALPVYQKVVLNVDIGGGSTEFVLGHKGEILFSTSLKLGHIRLGEAILGVRGEEIQEGQIHEIRSVMRSSFSNSEIIKKVREIGFEMAIGSSGTINAIYQVIRRCHVFVTNTMGMPYQGFMQSFQACQFAKAELDMIMKKLTEAKYNEEFSKQLGFSRRPISSTVAGLVILQEIFELLAIDKMVVSPYAIREGVIADILSKPFTDHIHSSRTRWNSAMLVAWKFNSKKTVELDIHCVKLAKELLEGLQKWKENGQDCFTVAGASIADNDIELMETAILLHKIGMIIGYKGYHKHSYYMIKNIEELHGFKPKELELIALLVRYHRKKFPSSKHDFFWKQPKEVQKKVCLLSVIIRLALALGQSSVCAIQDVNVCSASGDCIIAILPSMDPSTGARRDISEEVCKAKSESKHFEEVFKRRISFLVADSMVII